MREESKNKKHYTFKELFKALKIDIGDIDSLRSISIPKGQKDVKNSEKEILFYFERKETK